MFPGVPQAGAYFQDIANLLSMEFKSPRAFQLTT
jgi:hypothetical protein